MNICFLRPTILLFTFHIAFVMQTFAAVSAQETVLEKLQVNESEIPEYLVTQIPNGVITVDGKLEEKVWKDATKTASFVDLISGKETIHQTKSAILWDETYLYVAFWVQEPDVRAKYKKRDAPIYYDNDIEIFLAADNAYYEFEMNAFGTIYEALVMWDDRYGELEFAKVPSLDRAHKKTQPFNGVGFKTHPRGKRTIALGYDFPKLKSAVFVDGTINNSKDRDRGWTAEIALPFKGMSDLLNGDKRSVPPKQDDVWRMNLFRFNTYKEASPAKDSSGWAWSRHCVWDSHIPECFPKIKFQTKK